MLLFSSYISIKGEFTAAPATWLFYESPLYGFDICRVLRKGYIEGRIQKLNIYPTATFNKVALGSYLYFRHVVLTVKGSLVGRRRTCAVEVGSKSEIYWVLRTTFFNTTICMTTNGNCNLTIPSHKWCPSPLVPCDILSHDVRLSQSHVSTFHMATVSPRPVVVPHVTLCGNQPIRWLRPTV